jgi:hypothetical protein
MLYYIDTNGLYNCRKINPEKVKNCFTSIMAVLELITGITETTFPKRRAILGMVFSCGITIDYAFPEEIIGNSFDFFEECDFVEGREEAILSLVNAILQAEDYVEYVQSVAYNSEMGHQYFKNIDDGLSRNFRLSTDKGTKEVRSLQKLNSPENVMTFEGVTYDLNTPEGLKDAFPLFSRLATLQAMAIKSIELYLPDEKPSIEEVFISYNGLSAIYVFVFSLYTENVLLNSHSTSKNDAMDLLHLLYLKNDSGRYIVSDDKIFVKYFPTNTLSFSAISI